jgi:excisionase family DNA binding protein
MPDDELLTIGEAAKRLKISRMDLRRLLQDKKLPAIRTERRQWRISAAALKEFMDRSGAAKGE